MPDRSFSDPRDQRRGQPVEFVHRRLTPGRDVGAHATDLTEGQQPMRPAKTSDDELGREAGEAGDDAPSHPPRVDNAPGREPRQKPSPSHEFFRRFAHRTSTGVGSPWAFVLACSTILVWAVTGPIFHFSDTWQLVINTGTTIVTFLMVFLIQNTQNRDALAIHLKLDELIRALKGARNQLVDVEELPDEELERLQREFRGLGSGHLDAHPFLKKQKR